MEEANVDRATEIRRQVEYYFSDQNLPNDAFLLAKCWSAEERGTIPINLKSMMGTFPRMRRYKLHETIAALKDSEYVELVQNNKMIRRRWPLAVPLNVEPDVEEVARLEAKANGILSKKRKPTATGFEPYFTESPLTVEDFEEDRDLYDDSIFFAQRIETAIQRYTQRRKFHAEVAHIFTAFLMYGGIRCGPRQFTGRWSKEDLEDRDADEIRAIKARYHVPDEITDRTKWRVDFVGVLEAFLSNVAPARLGLETADDVKFATNVLRNFYNYLLHHDVCPEYADQIYAARAVCQKAEIELIDADHLRQYLPGIYNVACSTLFGGKYKDVHATASTWDSSSYNGAMSSNVAISGLPMGAALGAVMTGLTAHATRDQFLKINLKNFDLSIVAKHDIGVDVIGIETCDGAEFSRDEKCRETSDFSGVKAAYRKIEECGTPIAPTGKLHLKKWEVPTSQAQDVPQAVLEENKTPKEAGKYTVILETALLEHFAIGMKLDVTLAITDVEGIVFLDNVKGVFPSFYRQLPNELLKTYKQPGPHPRFSAEKEGQEQDPHENEDGALYFVEKEKGTEEKQGQEHDGEHEQVPRENGVNEQPNGEEVNAVKNGGEAHHIDGEQSGGKEDAELQENINGTTTSVLCAGLPESK